MKWAIDRASENWEADWEGDRRFKLRYFRSLSMREKLEAIEGMAEIVRRLHTEREAVSSGVSVEDKS